jgi:hypothetical protein
LYVFQGGAPAEVEGELKMELMRRLSTATVRKSPELGTAFLSKLKEIQTFLVEELREPSTEATALGLRPAVLPIFAVVVTD